VGKISEMPERPPLLARMKTKLESDGVAKVVCGGMLLLSLCQFLWLGSDWGSLQGYYRFGGITFYGALFGLWNELRATYSKNVSVVFPIVGVSALVLAGDYLVTRFPLEDPTIMTKKTLVSFWYVLWMAVLFSPIWFRLRKRTKGKSRRK
jgi:hypothetical protein